MTPDKVSGNLDIRLLQFTDIIVFLHPFNKIYLVLSIIAIFRRRSNFSEAMLVPYQIFSWLCELFPKSNFRGNLPSECIKFQQCFNFASFFRLDSVTKFVVEKFKQRNGFKSVTGTLLHQLSPSNIDLLILNVIVQTPVMLNFLGVNPENI